MEFGRLQQSGNLSDRAYSLLKNAIITGQLKPGETITEERLAEQLGISRTPLRAALRSLTHEGLLKIRRGIGTWVASHSIEEMLQVFEVRRVLERLAICKMMERLTPEAVEHVRRILENQRDCINAGDYAGYLQADARFHNSIAESSGNRELAEAIQRLLVKSQRYLSVSHTLHARMIEANAEHWQVWEAISTGDVTKAESALMRHLEAVQSTLERPG